MDKDRSDENWLKNCGKFTQGLTQLSGLREKVAA